MYVPADDHTYEIARTADPVAEGQLFHEDDICLFCYDVLCVLIKQLYRNPGNRSKHYTGAIGVRLFNAIHQGRPPIVSGAGKQGE